MLVKPFTAQFGNIGGQVFLRCDPKYRHFWDNKKGISIEQKRLNNAKLKDVLLPYVKTVIKKGPLDEERPVLELNDVESRTGFILQERMVTEAGSDKLDFGDCDFVFGKLRPYLGKIVVNNSQKRYIGTTEWLPLKLVRERVSTLFLKYLLLLPEFLQSYKFLLSGKEHPRIAKIDFSNMSIPLPSHKKQTEIEKKIAPIEERMVSLNRSLAESIDIINRVFAREFGFNLQEYDIRGNQKTYKRSFANFDKAFLLRSSVKFQRPKYDYLEEILSRHRCVKLKTLCASPIHRGVQPVYSKDGEVCVIKTANLKNEFIDLTEAQMVSQEFYELKKDLAEIKKGDVLIASTGVGSIGKVDIYELEDPAIADGHVSIVRFDDKKVNPLFMTYYLRCILGYGQIERDYSGATNQIEVYAQQLEQMWVIDLSPKKQDLIVEEVEGELKELQKQKAEIQKIRDEIDKILIEAIT